MHSDILAYLESTGHLVVARQRLRLLTKLYDEPFHVVVRKDIANISDLNGMPVAIGPKNSGAEISNRVLLGALGIKPEVLNLELKEAAERLKSGEIAGLIYPTRKGSTFVRGLGKDDQLRLLALPATKKALKTYWSATFTHEDYPGLVPEDAPIESLQMAAILVVFNWKTEGARYFQVRNFIDTFLDKHEELRENGSHPVWKTLDLAANVKGWQRYAPVQAILDRMITEGRIALVDNPDAFPSVMKPIKKAFNKYVTSETGTTTVALAADKKQKLFDKFLSWPNNPTQLKVVMRMTARNGVGRTIGTVTALNTEIAIGNRRETALLLKPDLKGLKPGKHAFHVHENPSCGPSIKDGNRVPGLAAGGHILLAGTGQYAGVKFGAHLGDLPDLEVKPDGTVKGQLIVPRLTLADIANRALMIHASQDDESARMACGPVR